MRFLLASLLFAGACSSAHADQVAIPGPIVALPRTALAIAPERIRAPYDVQLITQSGETAPTFAHRDRFYVMGNVNERYMIRITNPTPRRVEAVVTVDGLDVVDGEAGDLRKRGYIVPAYGETRIEGFRTSLSDVATFRFSSVDNSYAGRKGKARNVGVIAVAIFEEAAPPPEQQIIVGGHGYGGGHGHGHFRPHHRAGEPGRADDRVAAKEQAAPEARRAAEPAPTGGAAAKRPAPPPTDGDFDVYRPEPAPAPRTHRPGLGTEFGEQRYSAATYTRFMRAADRPIAIAELRYNDHAGLAALGIPVAPMPDHGEIMLRETADPFPGDHFARPPRH